MHAYSQRREYGEGEGGIMSLMSHFLLHFDMEVQPWL